MNPAALIALLFAGLVIASQRPPVRECQPYAETCTACKDCSACKHCALKGGKCSVCFTR